MRTTLTLDDDVAAKLKEEMKKTDKSSKDTVNTVLRKGLNTSQKLNPWVTVDYDNIGDLLEQIEGPLHQ